MQRLSQRYTLAINRKYERSGSLWQGRYRAFCVDDDSYVIACHVYIELNPVRAGMVSDPSGYRWSSHAANAGLESPGFLSLHPTIAALGTSDEQARKAYGRHVRFGVDEFTLAAFRDGALPTPRCQARA